MPKEMQLAQILSDLNSLSPGVCDPAAALALVSARPDKPSAGTTTATPSAKSKNKDGDAVEEEDADLKRARELVELHYAVRLKCKTGELARGLAEARGDVERALGG